MAIIEMRVATKYEVSKEQSQVGVGTGRGQRDIIREVSVLHLVEFVHQGRRYRGKVGPVPGGGPEFKAGAWFVSMDDGPVRRVFEANPDDADTPDFRHRMLIATWLTDAYNRRVSGERRRQGERDASVRDRRSAL